MKSVLVIRFSSIGDIVLCSPVVRNLHNNGYRVSVITKKSFGSLWKNNPYVSNLILIEDLNEKELIELKNKNFDFVVDLHNNRWSNKIKSSLKTKNYTLSKSNINKALLVWTKLKVFKSTHIVDRYLETILPLVNDVDDLGLDFYEDSPSLKIEKWLNKRFVVFVIGGQHSGKMMSQDRLVEFCKSVDIPLLLLGGPEDEKKGDFIANSANSNIVNYAGKLSLMDSVNLLKRAELVISHDTGLMHIASSYSKHIVSLWGATTPELGFGPYKAGELSVKLEEFHPLRPSSKLGKQRVFKGVNFIDRIPIQRIKEAVENIWK